MEEPQADDRDRPRMSSRFSSGGQRRFAPCRLRRGLTAERDERARPARIGARLAARSGSQAPSCGSGGRRSGPPSRAGIARPSDVARDVPPARHLARRVAPARAPRRRSRRPTARPSTRARGGPRSSSSPPIAATGSSPPRRRRPPPVTTIAPFTWSRSPCTSAFFIAG